MLRGQLSGSGNWDTWPTAVQLLQQTASRDIKQLACTHVHHCNTNISDTCLLPGQSQRWMSLQADNTSSRLQSNDLGRD
jgi:hypothetical protein